MTTPAARLRSLATDLKIGIRFCTRLPLGSATVIDGRDVARASWAVPVAGALVAVLGALIYWVAYRLWLAPQSAAALVLVATLLTTGALHEDGLADMADGFGGGNSRERKLEIMRDSRIGTYGVCALTSSFILRWSALATIAEPTQVAMALIAAHVSSRAALPIFMRLVPPARTDGLSAQAGHPPWASVAAACVLGVLALVVGVGPVGAILGLLLLLLAGAFMAWLTIKQVGGQTGDVLGALEQVGEILILLTAATLHR
jgi:adenosylcobinamide-GDP ribazoletransferase